MSSHGDMIVLLRSVESMLHRCACTTSGCEGATSAEPMAMFRHAFVGDSSGAPSKFPSLDDAQLDLFVATFNNDNTLASLGSLSCSRTMWKLNLACDAAYLACVVLAREAHARAITVTDADEARARTIQLTWQRLCLVFADVLDSATACAQGWLYAGAGVADERAWGAVFRAANTCMQYLLLACKHDAVLTEIAQLAPPSLAFWMGCTESTERSSSTVLAAVQLAGRIMDAIPGHKSRGFLERPCIAALERRLCSPL